MPSDVLTQDYSCARPIILLHLPHKFPPSWCNILNFSRMTCIYLYLWVILTHSYSKSYQKHTVFSGPWRNPPIKFSYPSTSCVMTPFIAYFDKFLYFPGLLEIEIQLYHFFNLPHSLRPYLHEHIVYVNIHHDFQFTIIIFHIESARICIAYFHVAFIQ